MQESDRVGRCLPLRRPAHVLGGASNVTYWFSVLPMRPFRPLEIRQVEPGTWPDHVVRPLISAEEHGEDLFFCLNHDQWIGTLAEIGPHMAAGILPGGAS